MSQNPTRVVNEQTIFYFTHEQVKNALFAAVPEDQRPPEPWKSIRITAGTDLPSGGGATLTFQRELKDPSK